MGTAETMMPMSHDGLNTMSMKELKKELDVIGADYSRCIEKSELAKLLASNLKQGRKSKSQTKNNTTQEAHPVDALSMKEIRDKLRALKVDFSHCIEKAELKALLKIHMPANKQASEAKRQPMLSIREIKERLQGLGVDFSQCLEMTELVELLVAKEQGHSTNPFRENAKENGDVKMTKEKSSSSLIEDNLASSRSEDSLSHSKNSLRSSRGKAAGLRDITREEGNSQQPKPAKVTRPTDKTAEKMEKPSNISKPKQTSEEAKDVDEGDKNDVQACTEYVHDVYTYFRNAEEKYMPEKGYMEQVSKKETAEGKKLVNAKMRAIVVDWMIELHQRFRPSLQPATLYLAINVFDRFLASGNMKETFRLQVVGAACLLVAAKIEEIYPPKVRELKKMVDGATAPEICVAERAVLTTLKFQVSVPTVFHFMKRYLKAAEADLRLKALTMYIVEVALHDVKMTEEKPSLLASSAIHLALCMLGRPSWSATLQNETKYEADHFKGCQERLVRLLQSVPTDDTLYAVSTKFSSSKYLEVGKTPVTFV